MYPGSAVATQCTTKFEQATAVAFPKFRQLRDPGRVPGIGTRVPGTPGYPDTPPQLSARVPEYGSACGSSTASCQSYKINASSSTRVPGYPRVLTVLNSMHQGRSLGPKNRNRPHTRYPGIQEVQLEYPGTPDPGVPPGTRTGTRVPTNRVPFVPGAWARRGRDLPEKFTLH
eukprot:1780901-Rhodomonas_salina.2